MPQSNRVAVSASLRTHAIWTDSVGYDPYAPEKPANPEEDLLKDKAKELLTLARLTGTLSSHTPGSCPKCGQVGHLGFQCRNDVTFAASMEKTEAVIKQKEEEEDDERLRRALGIGSDDESPRRPPSLKRRRPPSPDRSSSTSSESDSDSSSRKKRKRKNKKHKKDKKKHKHRKEKESRKKRKKH